MKNKECDIIRDLLPSYVEELCSEASKEWVEAHMADCEECRTRAELLKSTEISAKELDIKQLDATHKIKQKNLRSRMVSLGMCLFLAALTVLVINGGNQKISHAALSAALPICILMTWFVNRSQKQSRRWDKWDTVSVTAAVLTTAYGIGMMWYICLNTLGGGRVFGLELSETGPFLLLQIMLSAGICFAVYVVQIIRLYCQGSTSSIILNLALCGIFLMLIYGVLLGQLSDAALVEEWLKKTTVTVLDIGLMSAAMLALLDRFAGK